MMNPPNTDHFFAPPGDRARRIPLYRKVMEQIRGTFHAYQPGHRLKTEAEYVRECGVSIATVRQALLELEREGVIERRQGSGTYLADRPPAEKHVAILFDGDIADDRLSNYHRQWLRALQEECRRSGVPHRPYLGRRSLDTLPNGEITCPEIFDDWRLDRISGVIATLLGWKWKNPFLAKGTPMIDSSYGQYQLIEHSLRAVLSHFKSKGRRRIAVAVWEHPEDGISPFSKAFTQLMPEYGLEVHPELLIVDAEGWTRGSGWERFRDICRQPSGRPDAFLIGDDALFEDCQKAILEMKIRVPENLCVALRTDSTFRDLTKAELPLFIWEQNVSQMARLYIRAIRTMLQGEPPPELTQDEIRALYRTYELPYTPESPPLIPSVVLQP